MRIPHILAALAMTIVFTGCGGMSARMMGGGGADPVQQHIDGLKAAPQVMYFVNFHQDPAVGQWAKHKNAMGEEWYGVVGGEPGKWLVEKRYTPMGQTFQIALLMQVDDQGSVSKAWAAEYDPEAEEAPTGVEVPVMAKPEMPAAAGGEAADAPKPTWSKEECKGMQCDKMTLDKTEIWYSTKVFFANMLDTETPNEKGGVVKMVYDGTCNQELVKQGVAEDLSPSVAMPEA
jgi:hypothetical protein